MMNKQLNTHYFPKVYTASKLKHADLWKGLRLTWHDIDWTARWPDLVGGVEDNDSFAREFWRHDIQDVMRSDCVLVYAEAGEHLRGALIEAGAGIALGKHVIVVGEHPDYGTWQHHPMVSIAKDLTEAYYLIIGSFRKVHE